MNIAAHSAEDKSIKDTRIEKMATEAEIREEDKKIRYLRRMVDFTIALIIGSDMPFEEASRHAGAVRDFALRLFPGKGHVFDIVYAPRLRRVLADKYRLS